MKATTIGIAAGAEAGEEIRSTTTKTFTRIAATTTRRVKHRRARPLDRLAATLARPAATLVRPRMQAGDAAQARRDPQHGPTTLPVRGLIDRVAPAGASQHSPRRAPCRATRVWEGRPPQGGALGPEGGARDKASLQVSDRIAPSRRAAMGLALRIEAHREVAPEPSGATERGDEHSRRAIGDDQVLADAEGVEATVVEAAVAVEEVVAVAAAAVVVEAGAREEVDHRS